MNVYHWPIVVALAWTVAGEAIAIAETKECAIDLVAKNAEKRILSNRNHPKELTDGEAMWIYSLKEDLRESECNVYQPPQGFAIDGSS